MSIKWGWNNDTREFSIEQGGAGVELNEDQAEEVAREIYAWLQQLPPKPKET